MVRTDTKATSSARNVLPVVMCLRQPCKLPQCTHFVTPPLIGKPQATHGWESASLGGDFFSLIGRQSTASIRFRDHAPDLGATHDAMLS